MDGIERAKAELMAEIADVTVAVVRVAELEVIAFVRDSNVFEVEIKEESSRVALLVP